MNRTTLKEGMKKYVVKLVTYLLENNIPHEFYHLVSYVKPTKGFFIKTVEKMLKLVEKVDFKLDKVRVFEEIVVLQNLKHSLPPYNDDLEFYAVLFRQYNFIELKKTVSNCHHHFLFQWLNDASRLPNW